MASKSSTSTSFLEALDESVRETLLDLSTTRVFKKGELLIVEGSDGDSMLMIGKGSLEVTRGEVTLASLGNGAVVGEMALLDPAPRSASVIATSSGKAYELSRETFLALLDERDPTSLALLQLLTATVCDRLGKVNKMVEDEVIKPEPQSGFKGLWNRIRSAL